MNNLSKYLIIFLVVLDFILIIWIFLNGKSIPLLQPKGIIANQQLNLLQFATILSAIALIPVFVMTFLISYRYRANNSKAKYTPNWDHDKKIQAIWWIIPTVIILILAVVTIKSTHSLDPYKPIATQQKPVTIQVIALQWKWLFIYPEYNIATVNFLMFPEKTPLNFELTADAPMNSFWIPNLGGQIYAMEGMITKTHFMADTTGEFQGSSAEISGEGFAGMRFIAKSTSQKEFSDWIKTFDKSQNKLNLQSYTELTKPSENMEKMKYTLIEHDLFNQVVMKFMTPSSNPQDKNEQSVEKTTHPMSH